MIEIVSSTRCTACNICVRICPCNVFDIVPDAPPRIARQDDCQTCFMCEIYCPDDALYVAPNADGPTDIAEADVEARGLFGGYVRSLGWTRGRMSGTERDTTRQLREKLTPPKPTTKA
jgi:NAD-dependent dihydropyrimidine dehydrogenase PreA subunit